MVELRQLGEGGEELGNGEKVIHKLAIEGMHCASCVHKIEKGLGKIPGVETASVNLGLEEAVVSADPQRVQTGQLILAITALGYKAIPFTQKKDSSDRYETEFLYWKRRFWAGIPFATLLMVLMALRIRGIHLSVWVEACLAAPVYLFAGFPFLKGMVISLWRRSPDMNALVGIGATAAMFAGYFETTAFLLIFLIGGRLLEAKVKKAASRELRSLFQSLPLKAHRCQETAVEDVSPDALRPGDRILVKPGEQIPADGEILEGLSSVDESLVTGEPLPVTRKPGEAVFAGTQNQEGSLTLRVQKAGETTYLAQIARITEQALASKAPVEKLADRISGIFVPIVLLLAAATFFAWWRLDPETGPMHALTFAIAVLVIACPCALGLATPTAVIAGVGRGARMGILIKGGEVLEKAKNLHVILFDKTGTLTEGKPKVSDILVSPRDGASPEEVLRLAAMVENYSEHLLGQAIVRKAGEKHLFLDATQEFRSYPGLGAKALWREKEILVGSGTFMTENGIATAPLAEAAEKKRGHGATVTFVAYGGQLLGVIVLEDEIKAGSPKTVQELKEMGFGVWMLTGDQKTSADRVAGKIGIQKVLSGLKPLEKTEMVAQLKKEGLGIAMVGDGINDAPALAAADVGIAMASGSDLSKQAADITLLRGDPFGVVEAIRLARQTYATIRENLWLSFLYNVLAIPIAGGILHPAFGLKLSPEIAALAMSLSSVSVVLNSLRLKYQ